MKILAFSVIISVVLAISAACIHADDFSVHLDTYAKLDTSRALPKYKTESISADAHPKNIEFIRFENGWRIEVETLRESPVPSLEMGWLADAEDLLVIAWEVAPPKNANSTSFFHTIVIVKYLKDRKECRQLLRMRFNINANAKWDSVLPHPFFTFDLQKNCLVESLMLHVYIASKDNAPLTKLTPDNSQHEFADYQASFDLKYQIEYSIGEETLELGDVKMWYFTQEGDTVEEIGLYFFGQTWTPGMIKGPNPFLKDVESITKLPANMKIEIVASREYFENFVRRHLWQTKLQ